VKPNIYTYNEKCFFFVNQQFLIIDKVNKTEFEGNSNEITTPPIAPMVTGSPDDVTWLDLIAIARLQVHLIWRYFILTRSPVFAPGAA
jgi:hypothetical protein